MTITPISDTERELRCANADLVAECKQLRDEIDMLRDSNIDKVIAMSDDEINALNRLEGRDPKDVATITRTAFDIAQLRVKAKQDEALLRECLEELGHKDDLPAPPTLMMKLRTRLGL